MDSDNGALLRPSLEEPLVRSENENIVPIEEPEVTVPQRRQSLFLLRKGSSVILGSFADESGSASSILSGLATILFFGVVLGLALPSNPNLPTPAYRIASSIIGYTYFLAWSVSWYPQIYVNWRHQAAEGLSLDSVVIDLVGCCCYAAYTSALFWGKAIRHIHREKTGGDRDTVTVQSNDVAFALHGLVLQFVWLIQLIYYDRFRTQKLSRSAAVLTAATLIVCSVSAAALILVGQTSMTWLDYLNMLGFIKACAAAMTNIPQLLLNYQRKSTVGYSIWNPVLDLTGGVLSLAQLIGDSADLGDWSGITGNLAKLGIALVNIVLTVVFFVQHYIIYPSCEEKISAVGVLDDDDSGLDLS